MASREVLVVEDDTDLRESLSQALQDHGFAVTQAGNGQQALDLLHSGIRPGGILLDLMMPVVERLGASRRPAGRSGACADSPARRFRVRGRDRAGGPRAPGRRLHPKTVSPPRPDRRHRAPLPGRKARHQGTSTSPERQAGLRASTEIRIRACGAVDLPSHPSPASTPCRGRMRHRAQSAARHPRRRARMSCPTSPRGWRGGSPSRCLSRWRSSAHGNGSSSRSSSRPAGRSRASSGGRATRRDWPSSSRSRARPSPATRPCADSSGSTGGRYDLLDENQPFVGTEPMPPGVGFYPKGLTREAIEAYVQAHPEERKAIYDERTVVVRDGEKLSTIPYHVAYKEFLDPAARALRGSRRSSPTIRPSPRFLRLRAEALLSDDYYPSDVAWVELAEPEVRPDPRPLRDVPGRAARREGLLRRRRARPQRGGERKARGLPEVRARDPGLAAAPARGPPLPARARRLRWRSWTRPSAPATCVHGYQAVADNLPNDPRIHEEKGSKRIFFKNYMDARVREIIVPLARAPSARSRTRRRPRPTGI